MDHELLRSLRARRVVYAAVTVALCLVLAIAVAPWPSSPSNPLQARTVADQRAAGCADTLVVGLDGNGQPPRSGDRFGPTVDAVVSRVLARAASHHRSVRVERVPLHTLPATVMLRQHHAEGDRTVRAVSMHGLRRWREPIGDGVQRTLALLAAQTARCPDSPALLVGYAQGAAVVHRVLGRVAGSGSLAGLVGGVLIADPDRSAHSAGGPVLGSPAASRSRAGIFHTFLKTRSADVPAAQGSFGVWSVCTASDLACDPTRATVGESVRAVRSYVKDRPLLGTVARDAWRQMALWPVPSPRSQVLSTSVGEPVHLQLTLAPGAPRGATWSDVVGLPAGLTLSGSGLLAGTPERAGSYTIDYRTKGSSPITTGHSGSVLLTVTPASVSLSAGGQVSCLTRSDGTARCWGRNNYGQIGDGTVQGRLVPTAVIGSGWANISTSGSTTCGVKQDGTLWCWGLDNFGQLGTGRGAPVTHPKQVGKSHQWAQVAAAWTHTCATRTDGTLWCWGQNLRGQLGIGTIDRLHGTPQQVGTDSNWDSVTTGGWHTCGLTGAGAAYCWGHNAFGQVGDGTIADRSRPTLVSGGATWLQLSTAWAQTCGVTQTGQMWCWGFNRQGQLGNSTTTNTARPSRVSGDHVWTQVAAGDGSTCGIDANGQLWCWGDNRYGQLGQPASGDLTLTPGAVAKVDGPVALTSAGWLHTCTIRAGSTVACWGNNEVGQVGDGTTSTTTTRAGSPAVRHQVAFPGVPRARFLDRASPREVAARGLASRPSAARAAAGRGTALSPFTIVSMNELGSQHTAPGGDASEFAPARIRAEWANILYRDKNASLIGTQETQPDQLVALDSATRHAYRFYPGTTMGYVGAPQSVMWRRAEWSLVWKSSISIPFEDTWRPQPIVELEQRSTGARVYWINVHFSAGRQQDDRNKAMKILLSAIHKLGKDDLPILVNGDFNEAAVAFCRVVGATNLVSATGGSYTDGHCSPPRPMRVDWIFGSKEPFSDALMDRSPQVARTTDHAVVSARFGTG
jgi:alpha-tubulin suppressor-like RCC1 family protein/endonuclease/exonuclease/phosphatase family metal-dependent hydrolase